MATVTVNGVELFYEERGSGPPLLLVHGTGAYADLWTPVLEELATTFRVIAYDRRGFGRSSSGPKVRFADHSQDALALLKALDAYPATVVGWSGGGVIAMDLASSNPDSVTELFLVEPALHLVLRPRWSILSMQTRSSFQRFLRRDKGAAAQAMYRWASGRTTGGNSFDELPQPWRTQMTKHASSTVREMDQLLWPYPSRAAVRSISCPVTVIEGDLSDTVFSPTDKFVMRLLPRARFVSLPDAGHYLHIDQPQSWVAAIQNGRST